MKRWTMQNSCKRNKAERRHDQVHLKGRGCRIHKGRASSRVAGRRHIH